MTVSKLPKAICIIELALCRERCFDVPPIELTLKLKKNLIPYPKGMGFFTSPVNITCGYV